MEELEAAVSDLLHLRDTWILEKTSLSFNALTEDPVKVFSSENNLVYLIREIVRVSEEKPENFENRISHILDLVTNISVISSLSPSQLCRALLLKGKALNLAMPLIKDTSEAKNTLQKVLQLDSTLCEAWIELAEYEWATNGPESALSSLQTALRLDKHNSEVFWRLSMLLRQLPKESMELRRFLTSSDFRDVIESGADPISVSLRLAHSAVRQRPDSGRAWECLGNALFTAALTDAGRGELLSRSLIAFTQAAKHPEVVGQPHFHFNRAAALHYTDNFSEALTLWFRAALLDPAWLAPRANAMKCLNALGKMHSAVHKTGSPNKTIRRRISSLISTLSSPNSSNLNRLLGSYHRLRQQAFAELNEGQNTGVVCCGGVVTSLPTDSDLTLNLLLVDARGTFLVLRIFQIGKGSGPSMKDVIAIPNPIIEHCFVSADLIRLIRNFDACVRAEGAEPVEGEEGEYDNETEQIGETKHAEVDKLEAFDFRILRVPSPHVLCVNGSRVGGAWTAAAIPKNVFFASA